MVFRLRGRVGKKKIDDRLLDLHNSGYFVRAFDHDVFIIDMLITAMAQTAPHRGQPELASVLRFRG